MPQTNLTRHFKKQPSWISDRRWSNVTQKPTNSYSETVIHRPYEQPWIRLFLFWWKTYRLTNVHEIDTLIKIIVLDLIWKLWLIPKNMMHCTCRPKKAKPDIVQCNVHVATEDFGPYDKGIDFHSLHRKRSHGKGNFDIFYICSCTCMKC